MASLPFFPWIIALLAALIAAATDMRSFRIPNWLTFPLLGLGVLYHGALGGAEGLAASGAGMLVGFALLLPLYLAGGMGAGDIKLMAGLGAWLLPTATLEVLLLSCLFAGAYSLVLLFLRRKARFGRRMRREVAEGQRVEELTARPDRRFRLIPFGVTTAMGLVALSAWVHWFR